VHAISQVFTGAIYDILADIFAHERQPQVEDDAAVLHRCGDYLRGLVLRALLASPKQAASYADVANHMLAIASSDGKAGYLDFIRSSFTRREVLSTTLSTTLNAGAGVDMGGEHTAYAPGIVDEAGAVQDRRACCGTMNHAQYSTSDQELDAERAALAAWCRDYACRTE
jgi:hypothetical protein